MPPLLPISDLSWIAIFQEFTPNEQMVASRMSPRCAVLVRAANLKVKSLIITDRNVEDPCDLKYLKNQINTCCLSFSPAMQPLMDIPGEPSFPDYPMTTYARFSKCHCLVIDLEKPIDTATTEQIVTVFSAVTDLKYITRNSHYLVPLLQHPKWQCQLTNLMVDWIGSQQDFELIPAINGLSALQCLALEIYNHYDLPDLPILAQLKVVALRSYNLQAFVRSLERYATDNADLQVHLISGDTNALLSLSQPLHKRIVHFGWGYLDYTNHPVPLLCSQFRSLTSLSIEGIVTDVVPLFTALSQLHQLVHLGLEVVLWRDEELPPPALPLAQLTTLKALELSLSIDSHSQVQWLNLPVTMANLQTILIEWFYCRSCGVDTATYSLKDSPPLNSLKALNCFKSSLFTLHWGVPMNRLILHLADEFISAENCCSSGRTHAQFLLPALLTLRKQFQLLRFFTTPVQSDHHPKTIPPRRPLPDLVLITLFKMLTPNDQLMASLTSPRCAVLVRTANRIVKTLLITDTNDANLFRLKDSVDSYSLASIPSMQSLMEISGEPSFPDYPMTTTRVNKWNVLQLSQLRLALDTATIEQIATIFSAVADLKFITFSGTYCEHLVTLLLHPNWQCQLTNLMAKGACERDIQVAQELVIAINGLTALQQLALHWDNPIDLPDLTILAQLKVVVFDSAKLKAFLRSLEQYATDNADLQVHLLTDDTEALFTLS
ncbi:hypothetical protein TYRP_004827 [Tyrophagus putrescentiae]|nr:hypothetical protein TYRP_004827 [Tyrophagus putrescentiae]